MALLCYDVPIATSILTANFTLPAISVLCWQHNTYDSMKLCSMLLLFIINLKINQDVKLMEICFLMIAGKNMHHWLSVHAGVWVMFWPLTLQCYDIQIAIVCGIDNDFRLCSMYGMRYIKIFIMFLQILLG